MVGLGAFRALGFSQRQGDHMAWVMPLCLFQASVACVWRSGGNSWLESVTASRAAPGHIPETSRPSRFHPLAWPSPSVLGLWPPCLCVRPVWPGDVGGAGSSSAGVTGWRNGKRCLWGEIYKHCSLVALSNGLSGLHVRVTRGVSYEGQTSAPVRGVGMYRVGWSGGQGAYHPPSCFSAESLVASREVRARLPRGLPEMTRTRSLLFMRLYLFSDLLTNCGGRRGSGWEDDLPALLRATQCHF